MSLQCRQLAYNYITVSQDVRDEISLPPGPPPQQDQGTCFSQQDPCQAGQCPYSNQTLGTCSLIACDDESTSAKTLKNIIISSRAASASRSRNLLVWHAGDCLNCAGTSPRLARIELKPTRFLVGAGSILPSGVMSLQDSDSSQHEGEPACRCCNTKTKGSTFKRHLACYNQITAAPPKPR